MTDQPLSPAAQAVKDAAFHGVAHGTAHTLESRIAAALRAAVEQVVPVCSTKSDRGIQRMMIRNDLLIIATELEQLP